MSFFRCARGWDDDGAPAFLLILSLQPMKNIFNELGVQVRKRQRSVYNAKMTLFS
jgi:hypothetical protein